ncbi:MAG: LPXTG cell wall anchor domain protein, partial [Candidatus Levybacteria bacterium GW2011_GWC1_40_19]
GSNGIVKSITRRFTVFAAGTQVIEPATPSGQTATPTPIPTLIPTATPTPPAGEVELSPSPIPTIAPTGPEATVFAGLAGAVLAIFGLAVFAITRYKLPL